MAKAKKSRKKTKELLLTIKVRAPIGFENNRIKELVNKALDVGYADAQATVQMDESAGEAQDALALLQLSISKPQKAKPPVICKIVPIRELEAVLKDAGNGPDETKVKCVIENGDLGICIHIDGCGSYSDDNFSGVVYVETYNGMPRVILWNDINSEEPMIIQLNEALVSNRRPEPEEKTDV